VVRESISRIAVIIIDIYTEVKYSHKMLKQSDIDLFKTLLQEYVKDNLMGNVHEIEEVKLNRLRSAKEAFDRVEQTLAEFRTNGDVIIRAHQHQFQKDEHKDLPIKITQLAYRDGKGSGGKKIYANVNKSSNHVEFVISGGYREIGACDAIMMYEPWRQFPNEESERVMEQVYIEMVDAWNEKHGEECE